MSSGLASIMSSIEDNPFLEHVRKLATSVEAASKSSPKHHFTHGSLADSSNVPRSGKQMFIATSSYFCVELSSELTKSFNVLMKQLT